MILSQMKFNLENVIVRGEVQATVHCTNSYRNSRTDVYCLKMLKLRGRRAAQSKVTSISYAIQIQICRSGLNKLKI